MGDAQLEAPVGAPILVTVVHAPACHFCEDAEATLAELGRTYPLTVERVDIREAAGQDLVRAHRPPMSPLVLLDGVYFSAGRLPRRKLERLLDRRAASARVG